MHTLCARLPGLGARLDVMSVSLPHGMVVSRCERPRAQLIAALKNVYIRRSKLNAGIPRYGLGDASYFA